MHIPVLTDKVIEQLSPKKNQNFIDATLGDGGHTFEILERTYPKGKVLAIDRDKEALLRTERKAKEKRLGGRIVFAQGNFADISAIAKREKFSPVHGILFDLGMSSPQLEESARGFSFQRKEPLDMRYDDKDPLTAEKIVNFWSKRDIERILKEYGEERFAKEIAEAIVQKRADAHIATTSQLAEIIKGAVPSWYQKQKIHPATKTFQAVRMAVNQELESLKEALPRAVSILGNRGRIAVISFHSLEDRIVKQFFKDTTSLLSLTKKPAVPGQEELWKNPRSRSAKLRTAQKTE